MTAENASAESDETPKTLIEGDQVERYLRDHPNFFKHRSDLLMAMELPHGGAGAVSLVERQVTLLRERNIEMRNRLASINQTAEANNTLFSASRDMVLDLVNVREVVDLSDIVRAGLKNHFAIEFGELLWLEESLSVDPIDGERAAVVSGLLRQSQAYCGVFRSEEMTALFPDCLTEGSAALAPLMRNDTLIGCLAVGSSDVRRYDGDVGTLFLEYLADVVMRLPCLDTKDAT